jgi:outer membrane protein
MNYLKANFLAIIAITLSSVALILLVVSKSTDAPKEEVGDISKVLEERGAGHGAVVAYINGDSINEHYRFIVDKTKELEAKMSAAEARVKREYESRQQQYEANMKYAQEHPNMPESEAIALQGEMERLQSEMDGIQQREVGVLQQKEEELRKDLMRRVELFLKRFAKEKGIDYIFNKQSEINTVLYGDSLLNVTGEVLHGLNAEYEIEIEK